MNVRGPRRAALGLISLAIATASLAGCAKTPDTHPSADAPTPSSAGTLASASPSDQASAPAPASPSASAGAAGTSPSASSGPTAKRTTAVPTPTTAAQQKAVAAAPPPTPKPGPVAPPPPPSLTSSTPPLQSSCPPSYTGTKAPYSAVGAALTAAAGQARSMTLSNGGTDRLPPLPTALVEAIGWQESGWQSTILACDGGIGTMQIMPNTVSWMNAKFGTQSDVHTLTGNVQLGAQLIDWLVAFYGDSCFGGKYDLSPDPATGKTPLLDLVVAAYNAGAGNVHYNTTTDAATGTTIGTAVIPNPSYVASVKALMTKAPWTTATG